MPKLMCRDYGFDCDFVAEGETEKVIEDFRTHMEEVHGIDYSVEAVKHFLARKQK
jgi:predicted small metal-binding protein